MANDLLTKADPRDHFARIARKWSHFGPPLRPSPDDIAVVQRSIARLGEAARAVVLGLKNRRRERKPAWDIGRLIRSGPSRTRLR
jgi:hypothetical protein